MTPSLPLPLPLDLIERIEVREGHPLPGLAIGFGAGILVGLFVAGDDSGYADGNLGRLVLVMSASGGALLGFIIGESRVTWRPVYQRPVDRSD